MSAPPNASGGRGAGGVPSPRHAKEDDGAQMSKKVIASASGTGMAPQQFMFGTVGKVSGGAPGAPGAGVGALVGVGGAPMGAVGGSPMGRPGMPPVGQMMGMMPPGMPQGKPGMPPGGMFVPGGAPFHPGMMHPMAGMPPMGIPAYAKPPSTPPQGGGAATPPAKVASKAIKIVNPKTKQEVHIAKPAEAASPAAASSAPAAASPASAATPAATPAVAAPAPVAPAPVAPKPAPAPAVPAPINFAAMAAKPAPPPPAAPKPAPAPKVEPPKAAAEAPKPAAPAKPSLSDILRKVPEAPKPAAAPKAPEPPVAAATKPVVDAPKPPAAAAADAAAPKHKAVEDLAEAVSAVSLSKSESVGSDMSEAMSESGSTFAGGERPRSVPPAITEFGLVPKPEGGKYDREAMLALRDVPLSLTKPINWVVPDDIDYWPVPGFICPPGVQSFGGGRGGGRRGGGSRGGGGGGGYDGKKGDDKWAHRNLPDGGRGGRDGRRGGGGGYNQSQYRIPAGELPKLHKTDNKYVIGEVDDEEQKRQRSFKAILNKLTPDNFDKLLEKMLDVGIAEAATLVGLIGQLFEKALQEPTFSSLYAQLCQVLSERFLKDGVEFSDPTAPEGQQAITFKRVLLNKCQEEFESGDKAIASAEAGEGCDDDDDEDAKKKNEDGEEEGEEKKEEELEEGEVVVPKTEAELELEARRKEARRQDKLLQARRRMLGNIRFIGELFKKEMLTERIMHTCIMKLLGENEKPPNEEDVEALCKLMATVGGRLDHQKAKAYMDAYFRRMDVLSKNTETLSSRHRFMLQDVIEMRAKNWRERRKEEGPKKIEDVHRDAQRAAMEQTRRAGGGGRPERAGSFSQMPRNDSRRGSDSGFERPPSRGDRPQGGFQRSDSRGSFGRRDEGRDSKPAPRQDVRDNVPSHSIPSPRANVPTPKAETKAEAAPASNGGMDDDAFAAERKKITEYFYDDKDVAEAVKAIATWGDARMVGFVEYFLTTSFERRDMDWDAAYGLVRALVAADGPMSGAQLLEGFMPLFNNIEDVMCDLPKAGDHIAACIAGSVLDGTVTLSDVADALRKAAPDGEDPGYCLAEGFALTLFAAVLARAQRLSADDADKVPALYAASGVALSALRADCDKDDADVVPKLTAKLGLAGIA